MSRAFNNRVHESIDDIHSGCYYERSGTLEEIGKAAGLSRYVATTLEELISGSRLCQNMRFLISKLHYVQELGDLLITC